MASSGTEEGHLMPDENHDTSVLPVASESFDQWEDVTDAFKDAMPSMEVGEMIHNESFNLYAAMSAIELMDPKMDVGCGLVRDVREVDLPELLSDNQVINIMDKLLACEMSWLDAHTLPQTVFSCAFVQRLPEIPRPELSAFIRLQLITMDSVVNLIMDEKVADEEDFIAWTYGFHLRSHRTSRREADEQVLREVLRTVEALPRGDEQMSCMSAISLRLRFRAQFYKTIKCIVSSSHAETFGEMTKMLDELDSLSSEWSRCPHKDIIDADLISLIFDASINRHLMTSMPPRTAPLLDVPAALDYLRDQILELKALVKLRRLALPPERTLNNGKGREYLRYSLQVAMHAVEAFCADYRPKTLTRSAMSRLMIPDYTFCLFEDEDADFLRLLATDMGLSRHRLTTEVIESMEKLREGVVGIFKCMCRNRSRCRRHIMRALGWWDHLTSYLKSVESREHNISDTDGPGNGTVTEILSEGDSHSDGNSMRHETGEGENEGDELGGAERRTPVQIVCYEVSARLMIQHFLLGFECDLYQEYEYAAVYFYVGYLLTSMANATTSLATAGLDGASLHPLRYALYIIDEARLWLCRALYSVLVALSSGVQWDYSCRRWNQSKLQVFGSEELWYEQRFGVVSGVMNGPAYVDYSSFMSFVNLQEKSLLTNETETDVVLLRLKEAASGFLMARKKMEQAKKIAEQLPENSITQDVMRIARVAVENSLVISQIIRSYVRADDSQTREAYKVSFKFSRHQHFPVLDISQT